jgi:hypothetical protein
MFRTSSPFLSAYITSIVAAPPSSRLGAAMQAIPGRVRDQALHSH